MLLSLVPHFVCRKEYFIGNDTILLLHNIHWGFRFLYLLNNFASLENRVSMIYRNEKVRPDKQGQITKKSSKLHKLHKSISHKENMVVEKTHIVFTTSIQLP